MTLVLTEDEAKQVASIDLAIPLIEEAFRLAGERAAEAPVRMRMPVRFKKPFYQGFLQQGPAAMPTKNIMGFKLFGNCGNRSVDFGYGKVWKFIFKLKAGEPLAIIQSYAISEMRTAAASAVAAKYLSVENASSVGLYGSGKHAQG